MKKSTIGIIIAAVIVVGTIGFVIMGKEDDSEKITPKSTVVSTSSEPTQTPAQAANTVAIKDLAFSPSTLSVKKGTTVTWTNDDTMAHTVTTKGTNPESFDSGSLAAGKTFSHTFATVGTYSYVCNFHSSMTASVVVTE